MPAQNPECAGWRLSGVPPAGLRATCAQQAQPRRGSSPEPPLTAPLWPVALSCRRRGPRICQPELGGAQDLLSRGPPAGVPPGHDPAPLHPPVSHVEIVRAKPSGEQAPSSLPPGPTTLRSGRHPAPQEGECAQATLQK